VPVNPRSSSWIFRGEIAKIAKKHAKRVLLEVKSAETRVLAGFRFPDLPGDAFCNIPFLDDPGLPETRYFGSRGGSERAENGLSIFCEKVLRGPEKARYTRVFFAIWRQNARVSAISRKKRAHSRVLARFAPPLWHFWPKFVNCRFGSPGVARGLPRDSGNRRSQNYEKTSKKRKTRVSRVFLEFPGNRARTRVLARQNKNNARLARFVAGNRAHARVLAPKSKKNTRFACFFARFPGILPEFSGSSPAILPGCLRVWLSVHNDAKNR